MDCSLPVVSDDGDLPWSDSPSMDSDDLQSVGLPSPWLRSLPPGAASTAAGFVHTGQLSPISNGVDVPGGAADRASARLASPSQSPSIPAAARAGPSSTGPQSWSMEYAGSDDASERTSASERRGSHPGIAWDQDPDPDELLTVPKLEPMDDDDFCMEEFHEAPATPVLAHLSHGHAGQGQAKPKRPRGRPRKHPLAQIASSNKITKGRSKTGCLTCRKRKKKCDEAKPRCKSTTRRDPQTVP